MRVIGDADLQISGFSGGKLSAGAVPHVNDVHGVIANDEQDAVALVKGLPDRLVAELVFWCETATFRKHFKEVYFLSKPVAEFEGRLECIRGDVLIRCVDVSLRPVGKLNVKCHAVRRTRQKTGRPA